MKRKKLIIERKEEKINFGLVAGKLFFINLPIFVGGILVHFFSPFPFLLAQFIILEIFALITIIEDSREKEVKKEEAWVYE